MSFRTLALTGAAIAALVLSIPSQASYPEINDLLHQLPKNPNTVPSYKRLMPYIKTTAGGLVRVTPLGIAGSAGLAAAGFFLQDDGGHGFGLFPDSTSSQIPSVTGWSDANTPPSSATYENGFYYKNHSHAYPAQTAEGVCAAWGAGVGFTMRFVTPYGGPLSNFVGGCEYENAGNWYGLGGVAKSSCGTSAAVYCEPYQSSGSPEWPEDSFTVYGWNGSSWQPHTYESSFDVPPASSMPNDFYFTTPDDSVVRFQSNYDGSQTISEWLETNVNGETQTELTQVKVAADGSIASTSTATLNAPLDEVIANLDPAASTQTISINLPTDYAREHTLGQIRDSLDTSQIQDEPPNSNNYDGTAFDDLSGSILGLHDPDDFNPLPDLPSASACESITFNFLGNPVVFPSASGCDKLETLKTLIGWMLYLLTAFVILEIGLGVNKHV